MVFPPPVENSWGLNRLPEGSRTECRVPASNPVHTHNVPTAIDRQLRCSRCPGGSEPPARAVDGHHAMVTGGSVSLAASHLRHSSQTHLHRSPRLPLAPPVADSLLPSVSPKPQRALHLSPELPIQPARPSCRVPEDTTPATTPAPVPTGSRSRPAAPAHAHVADPPPV